MGRWSYLDSDEERLPAGMVRVGYDADTQTYTYRDRNGTYWTGAPGARYGELRRISSRKTWPSQSNRTSPASNTNIRVDTARDRDDRSPTKKETTVTTMTALSTDYNSDYTEKWAQSPSPISPSYSPQTPTMTPIPGAPSPTIAVAPAPPPHSGTDHPLPATPTTHRSVPDMPGPELHHPRPIKRTSSTLARLARFLSTASNASSSPGSRTGSLRRCATVAEKSPSNNRSATGSPIPTPGLAAAVSEKSPQGQYTPAYGYGHPQGYGHGYFDTKQDVARSQTPHVPPKLKGTGTGPGPGPGPGTENGSPAVKRATTFDEILAGIERDKMKYQKKEKKRE